MEPAGAAPLGFFERFAGRSPVVKSHLSNIWRIPTTACGICEACTNQGAACSFVAVNNNNNNNAPPVFGGGVDASAAAP